MQIKEAVLRNPATSNGQEGRIRNSVFNKSSFRTYLARVPELMLSELKRKADTKVFLLKDC